jgi:hypothetical protein
VTAAISSPRTRRFSFRDAHGDEPLVSLSLDLIILNNFAAVKENLGISLLESGRAKLNSLPAPTGTGDNGE